MTAITQVLPKVISRWAQDGRSPHQRTLSGCHSPAATVHQLAASPVREVRDR